MIDRAALKSALIEMGLTPTDEQVSTLATTTDRETEFTRLVRSIYDNLISLDIWLARNDPTPGPKRTIVQSWVVEVRSKIPTLPIYTPASTAALRGD